MVVNRRRGVADLRGDGAHRRPCVPLLDEHPPRGLKDLAASVSALPFAAFQAGTRSSVHNGVRYYNSVMFCQEASDHSPVRPMPLSAAAPILRTTWAGADARPLTEATLSTVLQSLSPEPAAAAQSAGRAVGAIHARRRIPARGGHWRPGVVVATNHTI